MKLVSKLSLVVVAGLSLAASAAEDLGSRKNPLKLAVIPSSDASKLVNSTKAVTDCLEKETGYFFESSVPASYQVVAEGFGAGKVDLAFFNTAGYISARSKYNVEPLLKVIRDGDAGYKAMIVVRADSKIAKVEDLAGKKFAFVDAQSGGGYILPKSFLVSKNVKLGETVFAGKHDSAVSMVYQGQVDAAAAYYNAPKEGKIRDARERLLAQYPDVEQKVKILTLTDIEIPNEPVTVGKHVAAPIREKLKTALKTCVAKHPADFKSISNTDSFADVKDSDYDVFRKAAKDSGVDIEANFFKPAAK